jgi:hypothetical protein
MTFVNSGRKVFRHHAPIVNLKTQKPLVAVGALLVCAWVIDCSRLLGQWNLLASPAEPVVSRGARVGDSGSQDNLRKWDLVVQ